MEEFTPKKRGRPRTVMEPVASSQVLLPQSDDARGDGEIGFRDSANGSPAPSRWAELIQKITALSNAGSFVTQLHTRDNRHGQYELDNGSAVIHGNQDDDFLVTSDGVKHPL